MQPTKEARAHFRFNSSKCALASSASTSSRVGGKTHGVDEVSALGERERPCSSKGFH
jgi:hypothetical protein